MRGASARVWGLRSLKICRNVVGMEAFLKFGSAKDGDSAIARRVRMGSSGRTTLGLYGPVESLYASAKARGRIGRDVCGLTFCKQLVFFLPDLLRCLDGLLGGRDPFRTFPSDRPRLLPVLVGRSGRVDALEAGRKERRKGIVVLGRGKVGRGVMGERDRLEWLLKDL
jgi:hypothetical protein